MKKDTKARDLPEEVACEDECCDCECCSEPERGEICYKSKLLNKYFDSYAELVEAEEKYEAENAEKLKKAEERKVRAKEVDEALEATFEARKQARNIIRDADKRYQDLLNKFVKDYGAYHYSKSSKDVEREAPLSFSDLIKEFFNF